MDKVTILYDGKDPFYPQPTPFVGVEVGNVYYGELWAKREQLNFEGQLTGCTFADIIAAQQSLVDNLRKNYQTLEIWQEENGVSGRVYQKDLVEIANVSFQESLWVGVLPYSISLSCYPSGYFSGAFGVLDPVDSWSFGENEDYTSNVVHTLSCQGYNTSNTANNALENAKNWVENKRGTSAIITPALLENLSVGNLCLLSSSEQIDRINGTYSIIDTYTSDLARTGYGILRYTTSFESGADRITVTLNGSVQGCQQNLSGIRDTYNSLDKPAAAAISYEKIFGRTDLNPTPLSMSINEDTYNAVLDFTFVYDNDNSPDVYFDYNVALSSGNNIGASINGNVIARGGDLKSKLTRAKAYADTVNLYNLTVPFYNEFYSNAALYPLNPKPVSSGIAINESQGTIALNADFNNNEQISDVLDSFDYSLSFTPSVRKVDSQPVIDGNGLYSNVSLGYSNRAALNINGSARVNQAYSSAQGEVAIKNKAMQLFLTYGRNWNAALKTNVINKDRSDGRILSFNFSWTFDSTPITNDFSTINSLQV